jgi:hypothetical protein
VAARAFRMSATADIHATGGTDPPRRHIAVHFAHWLVDLEQVLLRRALARIGAPPDIRHPLVVVEEHRGANTVVGCCELAVARGVRPGMTLSQAEAACMPDGSVDPHSPENDTGSAAAAAVELHADDRVDSATDWIARLRTSHPFGRRIASSSERMLAVRWSPPVAARCIERLGQCLERWIPIVALERAVIGQSRICGSRFAAEPVSTLIGDFTGCAQLFRKSHGTEQALMQRIAACFGRRGFRVHIATASTVGAASALARAASGEPKVGRSADGHRCVAIPAGRELDYLAPLPIESLRITASAAAALRSVEVTTIGQLALLGRRGVAERLGGTGGIESGNAGSRSRGGGNSPSMSADTHGTSARKRRSGGAQRGSRGGGQTPSLFEASGAVDTGDEVHACRPVAQSVAPEPDRDVLQRLDQALHASKQSCGEIIVPLKTRQPFVLRHDFEAPCARIEAIFTACGEIIDRLAARLHARRHGLRSATFVFRHADLPADLSTDSAPRWFRQDEGRHEAVASGSARTHDRGADGRRPASHELVESCIPLSLARPSQRRAHLWSVLRPRIERLPLDHGVESIVCTVQQTALLRFRQAQMGCLQHPAEDATAAVNAGARSPPARPEQAVWIDLVGARLGESSIRLLDGLSAGSVAGASIIDRQSLLGMSTHRPHLRFTQAEPAFIMGGSSSDPIARAIATRTALAIPHADRASAAGDATLEWRGRAWPLRAIDGWERNGSEWWSDPTHGGGAGERTFSRLCIGDGLWIFVRWPRSLGQQSQPRPPGAEAEGGADGDSASNTVRVPSWMKASWIKSSWINSSWINSSWMKGSTMALDRGVGIEVLGAW